MKAKLISGGISEIEAIVEKSDGHTRISLPENTDYSDIESVEFNLFSGVADANAEHDGYFVIPRGIGCNDYSLCLFENHPEDFCREVQQSNMPIFGMKTKKRSFLAVISGMSYDYTLTVKRENGFFYAYPTFNLYGETPYETPTVEYFELSGDDADYSGMARRYRKFREDKGELIPLSEKIKISPETDYSVNSIMVRIRCGWKPAPATVLHQTVENEPPMFCACSFDRVGEIMDEFSAQGIKKAEFCLIGWNIKGHDGRWPQAFPVNPELGGEEKLRELIKKAKRLGYQITCHTNSTDQYEIADIYSAGNTRLNRLGKPCISSEVWSGGEMSELCPKIGYEQAKEMLPKVAKLGFRGTHYIDVVGVLHPKRCYHKDHYVNSKQSVEYAEKLCRLSRELFGGISSEGAYDFICPFIDYGLYISFKNDNDGICDKPIPFWQIVYHGYVMHNPYALTVNCTFKEKDAVLKVIEYGGRPSYYFYSKFTSNGYDWMGKTDAVCDTDEHLKESVAKIKKGYELYEKLESTRTAFMEDHREITENVYRIKYSNGIIITVDYNTGEYDMA